MEFTLIKKNNPSRKIERELMVEEQIIRREINDPRVISTMKTIKRHLFVPPEEASDAYKDFPLNIGDEQTISQPYIVALMTQALSLKGNERVLEIGTGSGYQTAILGTLAKEVYSIETISILANTARKKLQELNILNIEIIHGNGYQGLKKKSPFDAIIVTASPTYIPTMLIEQLKIGGKMVIPVGESGNQNLIILHKTETGTTTESLLPVRFVPMVDETKK